MPQGKLRGGRLRGEVQSTIRESYGGKAVSSNFKSRVVHPRNPKLVKGSPEDDKVNAHLKRCCELCRGMIEVSTNRPRAQIIFGALVELIKLQFIKLSSD